MFVTCARKTSNYLRYSSPILNVRFGNPKRSWLHSAARLFEMSSYIFQTSSSSLYQIPNFGIHQETYWLSFHFFNSNSSLLSFLEKFSLYQITSSLQRIWPPFCLFISYLMLILLLSLILPWSEFITRRKRRLFLLVVDIN